MKNFSTKKIAILTVLLALCIAISVIDSLISNLIFSFVPGIKIGLANIIIVLIIYQYKFRDGLIVNVLKSIIVGLLFSGLTSFIIGGIASLLSYLMMQLFKNIFKEKISIVGVSFIGGIVHILTQLFIVSVIYKLGNTIIAYGIYRLYNALNDKIDE